MIRGRHLTTLFQRSFSSTAAIFDIPTYHVAIVGTGPAGFYTAHELLQKSPSTDKYRICLDFFEKSPTPYGLSRYGVAPDHPEVKNCEEYLDNIMKKFHRGDQQEDSHSVRFFGNTEIGRDVSLQELEQRYHSVVLSYGCTSADNKLDIPGSDLPGVISARQFVNWYNGHPDYHSQNSTFVPPPLDKIESVTIVGNGNVALDVARVLLADPETRWSNTDISTTALGMLRQSTVKKVQIVARRGLLESSFSNKEIRELLELSNDKLRFIPIDENILEPIRPIAKKLGRIEKRRFSLLEKYSKLSESKENESFSKSWTLKYLRTPLEIIKSESNDRLVSEMKVGVNAIEDSKIKSTSEVESIKNDLIILSIGYQGAPLQEFKDLGICFNRNKILNKEGRILTTKESEVVLPGWYTSGWIKNGPKGVIATTMMESFETADCVIEDLSRDVFTRGDVNDKVGIDDKLLKKSVTWDQWVHINNRERELGEKTGKIDSRTKLESIESLLEVARQQQ
ncbi:probable NADPH:adrenodoxin oxidoreductase, mitochondrial [[Candida] anglica]|uniref:NADPH:adrenodoxin oxidoreductase, mitochondrial n=1 Tax=[Candida] anglica TaxID=148631 RepID=A0ABP0EF98_9ASCO